MTTTITKAPGVARSETDVFTEAELFSGESSEFTTTETLLDQNADLPQYSVVGRITASGKITLSDHGASDGSQNPIGITCNIAYDTGADQSISIYRDGMFNPDRLNWHLSWNTDALKRLAFEAKQPTIFIRKIG